jgi:rare lipoprotein A
VVSVVVVGTLMGWTAVADPHPTALTDEAASVTRVDIDSLYAAQAAQPAAADTASISVIAPDRTFNGNASWYGPGFHGRRTANGERFNTNMLTAAHKTLPFGTIVRVTDTRTERSVLVRINDRGPFCRGRVLDLSEEAARTIGIIGKGTGSIHAEVFSAPDHGSLIAFNSEGLAVALKGYTVRMKSFTNFEEARARQMDMKQKGYDAYLIQDRTDGTIRYHITIGLYGSQRLCENLMAEAVNEFGNAGIIRLERGTMSAVEIAQAE